MSLFSKKNCSVCGGKIGLLGNRKLEDGNLCKECAGKLSPYFSDRRRSRVEDIKEQLAYREANKQAVEAFNVTRSVGDNKKILLDEPAGKFVVVSGSNWKSLNPDVMDLASITGADYTVEEMQEEMKRKDADGNMVGYQPARFLYKYEFWMVINVNHPYFDEIRFKLNPFTIKVEPPQGRILMRSGSDVGMRSAEYQKMEQLGEEMKNVLLQRMESAREDIAAASAPPVARLCPHCGATTTPDAQGRCEFCGGAVS